MDVFGKTAVDEKLIQEYFERNRRMKADEAWLKEHGKLIKNALKDTPKSVIGNYVVNISVPNTSKFNTDKVLQYIEEKIKPTNGAVYKLCTKIALNEEGFTECVENGLIDLDEVKEYAWEESTGSPRLTISERKVADD